MDRIFVFSSELPRQMLPPLPPLDGRRIRVFMRPALTAHRGRLLSGDPRGVAVHAGSFLKARRIILEKELLRNRNRLARIFLHEVFHFVWWRLGNRVRRSYEDMLASEIRRGAKGELGWSAESTKVVLSAEDRVTRSARWRTYACESFCDTAAYCFGTTRRYAEATLPTFYRRTRRDWLKNSLPAILSV